MRIDLNADARNAIGWQFILSRSDTFHIITQKLGIFDVHIECCMKRIFQQNIPFHTFTVQYRNRTHAGQITFEFIHTRVVGIG